MEKDQFEKFLEIVTKEVKGNRSKIDNAIKEEFSKGKNVKFDGIENVIESYKNTSEPDKLENKTYAVSYSGKPEITISLMIDSILYNNKVTLAANGCKAVNEMLYKIFEKALSSLNVKNKWIEYNSNYNEIYLKDNQDKFEKIVYVGDYFEYERFKYLFKKEVEYNNYGTIKLFVDKSKYKDDYKKMEKFAYTQNFSLEVYDDMDEFIRESREEDYAVIFADFNMINRLQKELKAKELLFNTFPYDSYKFKIAR